jgi:segregation and condensation protein B
MPTPDDDADFLPDLTEPDDSGLSLDELSQAYAAILGRGNDPYPQPGDAPPLAPADEAALLPEGARWDDASPDEDACEVTPKSILEAILFVGHPSGEPLLSERIAALMRGVRPSEIDDLVRELNAQYANSGAPYAIQSAGAGYQLQLLPEFAGLRDAFYGRVREARLSQAAVDVLAIVAYHQPIGQEQIDAFRSKPSGAILSQLVRRDLLFLERLPEKKSKPLYRTTERFLDLFDLDDLDDLPRSQALDRD